MSNAFYDQVVTGFGHSLQNLADLLHKAEAHAEAHGFDVANLLTARLYPDMFPCTRQIQLATDFAKGAAARLTGNDPPKWADTESTVPELRARIQRALDYLDSFEALAIGTGPYRFRAAAPDAQTVYNVKEIVLSLAEENGTWLVGDFSSISGGLANGLILRQRKISTSEILWAINMRDNLEIFGRLDVRHDVEYGTGVHQFKLALVPAPAVVQVTDDIVIEAVVRDDLTSINGLRGFIQFGEEAIS